MLSHRVDVCLTLQQTQVLNPCTLLPANDSSLLTCLSSPLIRHVPWGRRTHLQLLGYLPHLLNKWRPLFILLFLLGRYHSIRKHAWHAWRNRTSWRVWGGVKNCPARRLLTSYFLFDMTFPRKWTLPTDPAGRAGGGGIPHQVTTEREEGVTAIEVTQWLELQDTSVKQEGGGSSNPWNPDLLKITSNTAAQLELGGGGGSLQ